MKIRNKNININDKISFIYVENYINARTYSEMNSLKGKVKNKLYETWEELPSIFITSSEMKMGKCELLEYIDSIIKSLREA